VSGSLSYPKSSIRVVLAVSDEVKQRIAAMPRSIRTRILY